MSEKAFEAQPGDEICNNCDIFETCVKSEKESGGVSHDGARACKYFISKNNEDDEIDDNNLPWYQRGQYA